MKSLVKRKKSFKNNFKNKKNLFLSFGLFLLLISTIYLYRDSFLPFFYSYFPKEQSDVLAANQVSLTRINRYDIEFTDLDGQLKSIRPRVCDGFDIPGSPGVTSRMQTTCLRNYPVEFSRFNNSIQNYGTVGIWSLNYVGLTQNIVTDITGKKRINIFPKADAATANNEITIREEKYRPLLQDIDGKPVMFYYGGLHEINLKNRSTYLLTRLYDSAYYTRAFEYGNMPNVVYKLAGTNRFILYTPIRHTVNDHACFTCTAEQNNTKTGGWGNCSILQEKTQYCPGISAEIYSWVNNIPQASNVGKLSPELYDSDFVFKRSTWNNSYGAHTFRGNRTNYLDPNVRSSFRSYNDPYIDSILINDCSVPGAYRTNAGNLCVSSKNSFQGPYRAGYDVSYDVSCIGKDIDGSCEELILYAAKRDTKSSFSYSGLNFFKGNTTNRVNCSSTTSSTACYTGYELLHDNRWAPYSNLSGGYEIPLYEYWYNNNNITCSLNDLDCIRAIDWNSTDGKIVTYSSYEKVNSVKSTFNKPANFPPANVNFNFTSDLANFAIKINPPSGTNLGSMDIYKYGLSIGDGKPYSYRFRYNFTSQSPAPRYFQADEISVAFSLNSGGPNQDIDIMFSSLNANPNAYAKNELRVFRLKDGLSSSNSRTRTEEIIDITDKFNFTGIYPLTFRRYIATLNDGSGYPSGSEYFVFVSRDFVYHSPVPNTDDCILNLDSLSVVNTSPNSFYYGLNLPSDNVTPHLVLRAGKPIYCKDPVTNTDITQKPITAAKITFYDPINQDPIASFTATQIVNLSTLNFGGNMNTYLKNNFPSGMMFNFDLNFSMGNENVLVDSGTFNEVDFPNILPKGFSVFKESGVRVNLQVGGSPYNFTDNIGMTIQKNNFVSRTYNLNNLTNKSLPIFVNSTNSDFVNFFYDHNMRLNNAAARLEDSISYRICFSINVLSVSSSNNNFLSVAKNPSNSRCVDLKYLHGNVQSYNIATQTVTINLEPKVGIDISNVEFNGNVFADISSIQRESIFKTSSIRFEGSYITSTNNTSNLKLFNNSKLSFNYLNGISSLNNFTNFTGSNFNKFNLLYKDIGSQVESDPLVASSYIVLDPANNTSNNNFEIIDISTGRGVLIDLTNTNIQKSFDRYVLMNLDSRNKSRIKFKVDCNNQSSYSLICSGNVFNFKGAILGGFYLEGEVPEGLQNSRFIRIHENASILINLVKELRSNKYPTVTTTLVNLKYE